MDPHGVPSAGDWALDRVAAVFLQGTENAAIDGCGFERLDGNALMVSGYNRAATVSDSDFSFIGGNAVAAWGYTNETENDPGRAYPLENWPEAGVDGTDGEHPRGTIVKGCTAREVGLCRIAARDSLPSRRRRGAVASSTPGAQVREAVVVLRPGQDGRVHD